MEHEEVEILLVEDNYADLELTLRSLKKSNVANAIRVARDGEEALDILFSRGPFAGTEVRLPRVVVLDLKLPKVDGLEVLATLRNDARTALLPVVILTSSREQQDIIKSYELHVNSFIQKPVDFNQFQETVRQLGLYWLVVNVPPGSGGPGIVSMG